MYILNVYSGRKLLETVYYSDQGIDMNADIAFYTSIGLKVVITFFDGE